MKITATLLPLAAALSLAACGESSAERLADNVEAAADNRADMLEAQAEALENRAEQVRETGEMRSDAIEASDMNAAALAPEQRQAIIANDAAAVR